MPSIFYPKAYEAACKDNPPRQLRRLTPAHFEEFSLLNEALEWLTPQQRCDAIYASWLLSLNGPDSGILLEVRNRLVRQGGLDANYLAEFAQNADDAFPRAQGGEVRIWTQPGWLFVANNGRRFSGVDLLGLCRFFANGAKQITSKELTIGKFGIGFKSCYQIGTEVWVATWDTDESFAFRIPLCRQNQTESFYNPEIFAKLVSAVELINPRTGQDELGYCTPEYCVDWPLEISEFRSKTKGEFPAHGSIFAIRLHKEGAVVLESRLEDQGKQVYELCPLFLRRLRVTRLQDTTLRLIEHEYRPTDSIDGLVRAERVTLEAQTPEGSNSNARFWRLTQYETEKPWRIALHADSEFRLKVGKEPGEITSLREGAAYAFFPLGATTAHWPFNLHLHLDYPTNLSRSDWSPENPSEIRVQIRQAIDGLGTWLESHGRNWHETWSVSSLVRDRPERPLPGSFEKQPGWWLFEALVAQVQNKALLRTLFGRKTTATHAKFISIREEKSFLGAWSVLERTLLFGVEAPAWCTAKEAKIWGVPELRSDELVSFISSIQAKAQESGEKADQQAATLFTAVLGIQTERRTLLDECLLRLRVPAADCTMMELLRRTGGASLPPVWHECFRTLSEELKDSELAERSVAGRQLSAQLFRFSRPAFNPTWSSLPDLMHPATWDSKGDEFWTGTRDPCPEELIARVVAALRGRDCNQEFRAITEMWLVSKAVPTAFTGAIRQVFPSKQADYTAALKVWNLWDAYCENLINTIPLQLAEPLSRSLASAVTRNDVTRWIELCHRAKAEADVFGIQWGAAYTQALTGALSSVLGPLLASFSGKTVVSASVDPGVSAIAHRLCRLESAPAWLNDTAVDKISRTEIGHLLHEFTFLSRAGFQEKLPEIARQILASFHNWSTRMFDEQELEALNKILSSPNKTDRRQMLVGLGPRTTRALGNFILLQPSETDPNSYWLAQSRANEDVCLPKPLAVFPALTEVCVTPEDLKLRLDGDLPQHGLVFVPSEVADDIIALPVIQRILSRGTVTAIHQHAPINLEWMNGDTRVAIYSKADFYLEDNRLYVSRLKVRSEDQQFEIILGTYLSHSSRDKDVHDAWNEAKAARSPIETVYNRFRDRIFSQLCHALITTRGYSAHHIWRELLQNAENAYASLPGPAPERRPFEIDVIELPDGQCRVTATNYGRRFNQVDRDGQERNDVERIISVGGNKEQSELEIGRYHLGFKSVFSVTETVEVSSGGRTFTIKDLLLRHPYEVPVVTERAEEPTTFRWICSKQKAAYVAGIAVNAPSAGISKFLRPAQVVFTRFVTSIVLNYRGNHQNLAIQRIETEAKTTVIFSSAHEEQIQFQVLRGHLQFGSKEEKRGFAVAVKINREGHPTPIHETDQVFHLVFPTEHKSWMPFLIDGEFDMHGEDRGQLVDSNRNLSLITTAVRRVFEAAQKQLSSNHTKQAWIAWSEVLSPEAFWQGAKAFFKEKLGAAEDLRNEIERMLLACVPHNSVTAEIESLDVPSALLRRFASEHRGSFQVVMEDWIDPEIEEVARVLGASTTLTLKDWVAELPQDEPLLMKVRLALDLYQPKPLEVEEMRRAREYISRRMQSPTTTAPAWSTERVAEWWENNLDDEPYTLDGDLFRWVAPSAASFDEANRAHYLRQWLGAPEGPDGKEVWYRVLAYACLVSVGRRHSEVTAFQEALSEFHFFEKTSRDRFDETAHHLFSALMRRSFGGDRASGEQADYWRRLFYDIRKVHHLVYENDFAQVLLELCQREDRAYNLITFLRSGQLPAQRHWVGVMGQSALSPLFFVVRELRRLRVITHSAADETALFVCKPVRRTARRLGWITQEQEDRSDQDNLLEVASQIYRRLSSSEIGRKVLLPYFDIPLLALDQSGELDAFK